MQKDFQIRKISIIHIFYVIKNNLTLRPDILTFNNISIWEILLDKELFILGKIMILLN